MKALLCSFLTVLATAFASPAVESNAVPSPAPLPPPPDWSLVVLPELDWTPEESVRASKLLAQIKPDMIHAPERWDWLEPLAKQVPDCRIVAGTDNEGAPGKGNVDQNEASAFYRDGSREHPISRDGPAPATLLHVRAIRPTGRGLGPPPSEAERDAVLAMRVVNAFSEMSGCVVFLFDGPSSVIDPPEWKLRPSPKAANGGTRITHPVVVNMAALSPCLPRRSGAPSRVPLLHLITGTSTATSWDVLPLNGDAAIWHRESQGLASMSSNFPRPESLSGPPPLDGPPSWIDAYVNDNPSLLPDETVATTTARQPAATRLPWRRGYLKQNALGFPDMILPAARAIGLRDIDPKRLPHDAVRSPSLRFAFLPNRFDEFGAMQWEGDDGLGVDLADLNTGKSGRLYYAGLYSDWPVGATWFTDRYLLISGVGPIEHEVYQIRPEAGDARDLLSHRSVLRLRLYDLWSGDAYSAPLSLNPGFTDTMFDERIRFPDEHDDQSRFGWISLWQAVQSGLATSTLDAPLTPTKAAEVLEIDLPPTATWSDLGAWPPPESWIPPKESPYSPDQSGPCGDDSLTWRKFWKRTGYQNERSIFFDVKRQGHTVARAELMKVGGGLLPRLTKVGRGSDPKNGHLLMLGGHRPLPGPNGGREEWLLMIDEQSHHAWKLRWQGL